MNEKQQAVVRFVQGIWGKYRITLRKFENDRYAFLSNRLESIFQTA